MQVSRFLEAKQRETPRHENRLKKQKGPRDSAIASRGNFSH